MSKWIDCPDCGEPKEVPAYEGDGVYHPHFCGSETSQFSGPLPEDDEDSPDA
jgi:hypothetical protein